MQTHYNYPLLNKTVEHNYKSFAKIILICMFSILLSCILLINFSFALDMANLNNNIKGWYELNDSIYSDATDSTGNLNLTVITSGGDLINTDGIYNSAKTGFNGHWNIAYEQLGYMSQSPLINMSYDGTYTIHYVFRTDNFSSRTDENYFLGDLGEGNCGTFGIRILFNPYTNITSSYAMSQCNFIGGVVSYYTPQTDSIFLTVVYNSTNLKMYINDTLVNETGVSGLESTTPSDYITLGGFNYQTGFQSSEAGLYNNLVIDTFGYWNYEMPSELISYLYYLGNGITYPFILPANYTFTNTTGTYQVYTFTSTGNYNWTVPSGVSSIMFLLLAGGGGGGSAEDGVSNGGSGGAGGLIFVESYPVTEGQIIPLSVGNGGKNASVEEITGFNGNDSTFANYTSKGGGGGGGKSGSGQDGGSGGGAGGIDGGGLLGGLGTEGQGFNGGNSTTSFGQGTGGGAGSRGMNTYEGSLGGLGLYNSISGISVLYAKGGGVNVLFPQKATDNSGNGGDGGYNSETSGGDGGSGVIIIQYALLDNNIPTITSTNIQPTIAYINDELIFSVNCSDIESSILTAYCQIYNGTETYDSISILNVTKDIETPVCTVPNNIIKKGESWTAEFYCSDGILNSDLQNTTILISNSPPIFTTADFNLTVYNHQAVSIQLNAIDPDNDSLIFYTFHNPRFPVSTSGLITNDSLVDGTYAKIYSVSDGTDYDNLNAIFYVNLSFGSCSPEWICNSYGSCGVIDTESCDGVADSNLCGDNYSGNYSEFSPISCNYCSRDIITLNQTSCVGNILTVTYEDLNFSTCCDITGIGSDCYNNIPQNISTYPVYQPCSLYYQSDDIPKVVIDIIVKVLIFLGALIIIIGLGFGLVYLKKKFNW